jgi:hypothetical protein
MMNLVTPAIIIKAAAKPERPTMTCPISANTNFRPYQKEALSDEEHRQSESEFILD